MSAAPSAQATSSKAASESATITTTITSTTTPQETAPQAPAERKVYPTKVKTPEELAHWLIFVASVNESTSGEEILKAILDFELVDNGQAAFAFNRAKKMMESVGLLDDDKWAGKKYRTMRALKVEFFAEIYKIKEEKTVAALKIAVTTPTTSKGKLSILYGEEEAVAISGKKLQLQSSGADAEGAQRAEGSASSSEADGAAQGAFPAAAALVAAAAGNKRQKKQSAAAAASTEPSSKGSGKRKRGESASASEASELAVPPAGTSLTVQLPVTGVIEEEVLRQVKADRLAVAMGHPSYQLLTKPQQQMVRDEWMNMLTGK
jgi:hypothetical protein